MSNRKYLRKLALGYATTATKRGLDWQEVQFNLVNERPYSELFPDGLTQEANDETLAIIREAEEILGDEHDAELDAFGDRLN